MRPGLLCAMLFRDFLTVARFPGAFSYDQADWFLERTGIDSFDEFPPISNIPELDKFCELLREILLAGDPPPAGAVDQLVTDLRVRWIAYSQASQPAIFGSTHGSSSVGSGSPALGIPPPSQAKSQAKSKAKAKAKSAQGTKRPVGPEGLAELNFGVSQGLRAQRLIEAAKDDSIVAAAVQQQRDRLYAASTWSSHLSEVKLYSNFCKSRGALAFPMARSTLEEFVSMLILYEYCARSIPLYISAIFRQQVLLWMEIDQSLREYRKILIHGVKQGSGDSHRVLAITLAMLKKFRDLPHFMCGHGQAFLFRISVIQWFFLLRSDESIGSKPERGLCASAFDFHDMSKSVTITLGVTKSNREGLLCRRTHICVCDPLVAKSNLDLLLPLCPYCAAKALVESSPEVDEDKPLKAADGTSFVSSHQLAFLRKGLEYLGFKLVDSKSGRQLYGTHSLRRGGAQALVAAGWTLEAIKFFGRWLSNAVELYLLQSPTQFYGEDLSKSMAGVRRLQGSADFRAGTLPPRKVQSFSPTKLEAGMAICVRLPDLAALPLGSVAEEFEDDLPTDDISPVASTSGLFDAIIVSFLPTFPEDFSSYTSVQEIVWHHSYTDSYSRYDFTNLQESDLCPVVCFGPDLPLYVLNLRVVGYSLLK